MRQLFRGRCLPGGQRHGSRRVGDFETGTIAGDELIGRVVKPSVELPGGENRESLTFCHFAFRVDGNGQRSGKLCGSGNAQLGATRHLDRDRLSWELPSST